MYTALRQAFRRHRVKGGILDVWEAYTTQKCHRCSEQLATREVLFTEDDIIKCTKKHNCMRRRAEAEGAPLPPDPDPPFESRSKRDRDFLTAGCAGLRLVGFADSTEPVSVVMAQRLNRSGRFVTEISTPP